MTVRYVIFNSSYLKRFLEVLKQNGARIRAA